jgi:hypothetical protein
MPMMRLHWDVQGALREAAIQCEADVLGTWYENVGFSRLIMPGAPGLKSINDVTGDPWWIEGEQAAHAAGVDLRRTWDIATLGVRAGLEGIGQVAASALYYGILTACRENAISWIVAIIDTRVRSLLAAHGLMLNALPGTAPGGYLGSPKSAPVYANLPDMLDQQRRRSPEAHRLIALGVGLDGVAVPPPGSESRGSSGGASRSCSRPGGARTPTPWRLSRDPRDSEELTPRRGHFHGIEGIFGGFSVAIVFTPRGDAGWGAWGGGQVLPAPATGRDQRSTQCATAAAGMGSPMP